jgi:hypothetical protein
MLQLDARAECLVLPQARNISEEHSMDPASPQLFRDLLCFTRAK